MASEALLEEPCGSYRAVVGSTPRFADFSSKVLRDASLQGILTWGQQLTLAHAPEAAELWNCGKAGWEQMMSKTVGDKTLLWW